MTAAGTSAARDPAHRRRDRRSGPTGALTAVTDGSNSVELDDELIDAVMSRPGETSGFSATLRLMCPGDSHQDRATHDHAERGRYGAVAAAERGRHVLQRTYLPLDDPYPPGTAGRPSTLLS